MYREFICIICPKSCHLAVKWEGKEIKDIIGAGCLKGKGYAKDEITNPLRVFTGSIEVINGDFSLTSVKTPVPIPKKYLKEIGEITHCLKMKAPIKIGQVIAQNLLGEDIDLIATRKVNIINK